MTDKLSRVGKRRFWEKHIRQWSSTELTQKEYCTSKKINFRSFRYWRAKLEISSAPALVELPLPAPLPIPLRCASPPLCLVVGPYRLEIGKGFDLEELDRVIRVLERI